ncbi:MAG: hypothetical protein ACFFA3_21445 [Promethearchaeota archaeon]
MTELKLKCYSCNYERIIGEKEFIEDLQYCPKCNSNDIEIIEYATSKDSTSVRLLNPDEWEQIVRRRMIIIGAVGIIFLLIGIPSFLILGRFVPFPLAITFIVIGVILVLISIGWMTNGTCCVSC